MAAVDSAPERWSVRPVDSITMRSIRSSSEEGDVRSPVRFRGPAVATLTGMLPL
jgi:hypothetical protein